MGKGNSSFFWLYFTIATFKGWKGKDGAKVRYCIIEQNGKQRMSKHPTVYHKHNPGSTTNPFDMAKEVALNNAQKTAPYPKTHFKKNLDTLDKVAMWIVVRCMPIQVACNEQFDVILKELDPKFPCMSDKEIRGTILQKHLQAIDQLKSTCPPRVANNHRFLAHRGVRNCNIPGN